MTEPTDALLPCPFCGSDARHDAHADDCYFILHHKFKSSGADMSPAFEVLAAWNRRTPQPAQAQAGAVPLSIAEVEQILSNWSYEKHGDRARYIVRMTEQAHGIKGG